MRFLFTLLIVLLIFNNINAYIVTRNPITCTETASNWSNEQNAVDDGNGSATTTGGSSSWLYCTEYDFDVLPSTITSITSTGRFNAFESHSNGGFTALTAPYLNGIVSAQEVDHNGISTSSSAILTNGPNSMTYTEIASASFGYGLQIDTGGGGKVANVDFIRVELDFELTPTITNVDIINIWYQQPSTIITVTGTGFIDSSVISATPAFSPGCYFDNTLVSSANLISETTIECDIPATAIGTHQLTIKLESTGTPSNAIAIFSRQCVGSLLDHCGSDNGIWCDGQEDECLNFVCGPDDPPCPADCVEAEQTCGQCVSDADCEADNGIWCDGDEDVCGIDLNCVRPEPPCKSDQVCNEDLDRCELPDGTPVKNGPPLIPILLGSTAVFGLIGAGIYSFVGRSSGSSSSSDSKDKDATAIKRKGSGKEKLIKGDRKPSPNRKKSASKPKKDFRKTGTSEVSAFLPRLQAVKPEEPTPVKKDRPLSAITLDTYASTDEMNLEGGVWGDSAIKEKTTTLAKDIDLVSAATGTAAKFLRQKDEADDKNYGRSSPKRKASPTKGRKASPERKASPNKARKPSPNRRPSASRPNNGRRPSKSGPNSKRKPSKSRPK